MPCLTPFSIMSCMLWSRDRPKPIFSLSAETEYSALSKCRIFCRNRIFCRIPNILLNTEYSGKMPNIWHLNCIFFIFWSQFALFTPGYTNYSANLPSIPLIYWILGKNRILGYPPNSANFQLFGFGRIFCWTILQNILPKPCFGRTLLWSQGHMNKT